MKNMRKILLSILAVLALNSNFAYGELTNMPGNLKYNLAQNSQGARIIHANIESQRIPAGTKIKIRMGNPINTLNSSSGDPFIATIIEDVKVKNNIILPAGTIIRGTVGSIKKASYLSRGGILTLNFDHVVTSIGRQIPVTARLSNVTNLMPDGSINAGGGYVNAVGKGFNQGIDMAVDLTNMGVNAGLSFGEGYPGAKSILPHLLLQLPVLQQGLPYFWQNR